MIVIAESPSGTSVIFFSTNLVVAGNKKNVLVLLTVYRSFTLKFSLMGALILDGGTEIYA